MVLPLAADVVVALEVVVEDALLDDVVLVAVDALEVVDVDEDDAFVVVVLLLLLLLAEPGRHCE